MPYYCLSVKVGSEQKNIPFLKALAIRELEDYSLKAYFPVREMKDKKGGIFITHDQPMIPGYLLIYSDKELGKINREIRRMSQSSYGLLKYSDGTFDLKGRDLEYATWIFSLEGRITASKVKVINNIQKGDSIVVISGPLKDFKGKIIKMNKNSRVLVEVEFLGDIKTINLPIEILNKDHSVEKSSQSATEIITETVNN